jgi:glycyl-tRNA synthetase
MQPAKAEPTTTPAKDMKDIVALCKRRGFIFGASDIYGGINGFWDYGPLGTELKNNLRDLWWRRMVLCPPIGPDGHPVQIVGLDSAIIQNPKVWVASGHVGGFSDPMVDCKETKLRYRADHLFAIKANYTDGTGRVVWLVFVEGTDDETIERRAKKLKYELPTNWKQLGTTIFSSFSKNTLEEDVIGPDASKRGTLTEPKAFNLLFETRIGAVQTDDNIAYLRGETAQGIFINYKNVLDSSRVKIPFGIAQVGKAFRNEVNPRNFIFRSREFEQMEMEWFCDPNDKDITPKMWFDFWKEERKKFWQELGLSQDNLLMREHDADELVFYSKGTFDIEYHFPFNGYDAQGNKQFGELEGIAYRTDYDLTQHQTHSGEKMEYIDPDDSKNRYIPHVIEPAAGLTRGVLALLCEAYTPDPNRPSGVYLNFHPKIAPKKAAILPLTAKEGHPEKAEKLYMALREEFPVDLDIKQNIGKRYARQDEIGTPFCFTIDNDTMQDDTVTVRDRNTMAQERIGMDHVAEYMRKKMKV